MTISLDSIGCSDQTITLLLRVKKMLLLIEDSDAIAYRGVCTSVLDLISRVARY